MNDMGEIAKNAAMGEGQTWPIAGGRSYSCATTAVDSFVFP
jgi:hypothetical protein